MVRAQQIWGMWKGAPENCAQRGLGPSPCPCPRGRVSHLPIVDGRGPAVCCPAQHKQEAPGRHLQPRWLLGQVPGQHLVVAGLGIPAGEERRVLHWPEILLALSHHTASTQMAQAGRCACCQTVISTAALWSSWQHLGNTDLPNAAAFSLY